MPETRETEPTVTIPLSVAHLVDRCFLPLNPNKLRSAAPETIAAAHAFKQAVETVRRTAEVPHVR